MKTVSVDRLPGWTGDWELDGFTFDIDDKLSGVERDRISRRANAIAFRAARLDERGLSFYEDADIGELLTEQYAACRKHIGKVHRDGKELTAAEREAVLDSLNILSRDALSNEVAGANALGLKNASGSLSS